MHVTQSELAAALGVSKAAISQWLAAGGTPPAERCPAIERATRGVRTCERLRPDMHWQRVPDADWPHPQGRPCLDLAHPAPAALAECPKAA